LLLEQAPSLGYYINGVLDQDRQDEIYFMSASTNSIAAATSKN
jgi:ATP-dependent DNA helicase RecQ